MQSITKMAWSRSNIAHLTQLAKAPRIAEVYLVSGLQILFEDDSKGDRCCLHGGIGLKGWVIPPASLCMHCLCNGGIEGPHSANKVEQHLNRQLLWGLLAAFAGSVGCSLPALVILSRREGYCTTPRPKKQERERDTEQVELVVTVDACADWIVQSSTKSRVP